MNHLTSSSIFSRTLLSAALITAGLFNSNSLLASESYLDTLVVTSATRTQRSAETSPFATSLITEKEIMALGAITLRDILMHSSSVFANPGLGDISIRGVGGNGTLLLVDGRRLGGESGMGFEMNRIPASAIERIEIVKGPMGVLYGSDAIGGVINIITKKPQAGFEGMLATSTGSNTSGDAARYQLEGDVRGREGKLGYSGWFSLIKQEEYSENETAMLLVGSPSGSTKPSGHPNNQVSSNLNDSYSVNVSYREPSKLLNIGGTIEYQATDSLVLALDTSYLLEKRDGSFIASMHPSNYGASGFPVRNVPIENNWTNDRLDLAARAKWEVNEQLLVNWRSYRSYYEKEEDITSLIWQDMGYSSQADSSSVSGTGKVTVINHELLTTFKPLATHRFLAGAEYRSEERSAPFFNPQNIQESVKHNFSAIFAQHEWDATNQWTLIYGLRYDQASDAENAASGTLASNYRFNETWRVRASYARGYQTPGLPQIFLNRETPQGRVIGAAVVDNGLGKEAFDLDPETSDNFELGISGQGSNIHANLAIFHNRISDRIDRVSEGDYTTYRNASEAQINGLEVDVTWQIQPALKLLTTFTYLDTENKDTGTSLTFTPDLQASLGVKWQTTQNLSLYLDNKYIAEQFIDDKNQADDFYMTNIRATYLPAQWMNTEFYVNIENLLDEKIDTLLGSDPGVRFNLGARYYF